MQNDGLFLRRSCWQKRKMETSRLEKGNIEIVFLRNFEWFRQYPVFVIQIKQQTTLVTSRTGDMDF